MKKILDKILVNKDFGNIGNHEGTAFKDIEVKMDKDNLVEIFVGLGLIGIGAAFLIHNSFYTAITRAHGPYFTFLTQDSLQKRCKCFYEF